MIIQILLPSVLAFIMFAMGLELTLKDFKNVFKFPKAFTLGMILQVVLLPLIAFGISNFFELPDFLAIGLIIIACCPGGVTSNYLTHMAKGDTALSVSLTAIASVIGIITIPIIIKMSIQHFSTTGSTDFSILGATLKIFFMTTVPVSIGMFIKYKFPRFTELHCKKIEKVAAVLFVLILFGAIIKERQTLIDYFPVAGFSALGLNIATMLTAIIGSRIFKLPGNQEIALTIECGFQNASLAMVIASTILQKTEYMVTAGVYGVLMFFTATAYLLIVKKFQSKKC